VQIARRSPASTWLSGSGSPPGGRRMTWGAWPGRGAGPGLAV